MYKKGVYRTKTKEQYSLGVSKNFTATPMRTERPVLFVV